MPHVHALRLYEIRLFGQKCCILQGYLLLLTPLRGGSAFGWLFFVQFYSLILFFISPPTFVWGFFPLPATHLRRYGADLPARSLQKGRRYILAINETEFRPVATSKRPVGNSAGNSVEVKSLAVNAATEVAEKMGSILRSSLPPGVPLVGLYSCRSRTRFGVRGLQLRREKSTSYDSVISLLYSSV